MESGVKDRVLNEIDCNCSDECMSGLGCDHEGLIYMSAAHRNILSKSSHGRCCHVKEITRIAQIFLI